MSTNILGTVFKVIAILAFLISKIFQIGKVNVHAPYFCMLVVLFEFLLIRTYNNLMFRGFELFNSTSTARLDPAFYQVPTNATLK